MPEGHEWRHDVEAARRSHNLNEQTPNFTQEVLTEKDQQPTDPGRTHLPNDTGAPAALEAYSDDDDKDIVSWAEGDPENPYNWSTGKKNLMVLICMMLILNGTMGTALPSNAIPFIMAEFDVTSDLQHVLPISVFMIGYTFGPLFWGPLSEQYGRRVVIVATILIFAIWTMACALAPNWAALNVFRLLVGFFCSPAVTVVPGVMADIFASPKTRGRAMAFFMAMTCFGPLIAPIVSGYVSSTIGWRWSFWIALIYAGLSIVALAFLPETLGPVLLARRAAKLRKADPVGNAAVVAPRDLEPKPTLSELVSVVFFRPLRMLTTELIVACVCFFLSLVYAIFYMSFQAFPIIFGDLYGLSPGETGLCFLGIGAGSLLSLPIFFAYDPLLRRFQANPRHASWAHREEFRRLPLACLGGPLWVISLFWLGFSARDGVSVAAPILAGVPFGIGFLLLFMALLNYLTDAYEIFAASANAASSMTRSSFAIVLPLATTPMFNRLGIAGACSLLGGLSAVSCIIPFIFIWKGERIRAGSKFCIALQQRKEDQARKDAERRRRREARAAAAAAAASERGDEPAAQDARART